MSLYLSHSGYYDDTAICVTGSKSESNRLLIIQSLLNGLEIQNLSNSDDTRFLQNALTSHSEIIDIHHAGTAMRFLTAYFAIQEGRKTILTGSKRMTERPIGILVDALRSLGADIEYGKEEGYPPLIIKGKELIEDKVSLKANVSSQYISALMLIGGALTNGLRITLNGKITSVPYIEMTVTLLKQCGIKVTFEGQHIQVFPIKNRDVERTITVESDWSSVSYFYSIAAFIFSKKDQEHYENIKISSYKEQSIQGDAVLQDIYRQLGVESSFEQQVLCLKKNKNFERPQHLKLDLSNAPDIAQTISVSCLGLGIGCELTGLHTLKIKETDRLEALEMEITKLGGNITVTEDTLVLKQQKRSLNRNITIETYNDHRMAMAFAPLALYTPLFIQDSMVVSKSYPDFWKDIQHLGFHVD